MKKYFIYAALFLIVGLLSVWAVVEYLPQYFGTQKNQHAFIDELEKQGLIEFNIADFNAFTLDRSPFHFKKNMNANDWSSGTDTSSTTEKKSPTQNQAQEEPQIVIVSFWASWCSPCVEEFPSMVELVKQFNGKIKILAISEDYTEEDIQIFLKGFHDFNPTHIKIVWDKDQKLLQLYKVFKMPEAFIFNKDGKLIKKVSGSIKWADPDALSFFKQLI